MNRQTPFENLENRTLFSAAGLLSETSLPAVGTIEVNGTRETEVISWGNKAVRQVRDQWIVRLNGMKGTFDSQSQALQTAFGAMKGFSVEENLGSNGVFTVKVPSKLSESKVVTALQKLPGYVAAEPDLVAYLDAVPNDPNFSQQWGLRNTGQSGGVAGFDINATAAWDITSGNGTQIVGIIDSGVAFNHPDLLANTFTNPGEIAGNGIDDDTNGFIDDVHGWNFLSNNNDPTDVFGHGTHVAGTVAAVGNNGVGVTGVAWNSKILPLKVGGLNSSDNTINTSAAIAALNYVVMMKNRGFNIRVTNNSWGGSGFSSSLVNAITQNGNAGILFVCAAGNDGLNIDITENARYPAAYTNTNIITVANITRTGSRNSSSNFGTTSVDLGAPGTDVRSTYIGNSYANLTGTSMSSPHVAGAASLLFTAQPTATAAAVKAALLNTASPTTSMSGVTVTGGRLNLAGALATLANLPASPSSLAVNVGSDTGVSSTDRLTNDNTPTIEGNATVGATVTLFIDDVQFGQTTATDGTWSFTSSPLSDGVHTFYATSTTSAGTSLASNSLFVTVDTVAPSAFNGTFQFALNPHRTTFKASEAVDSVFSLANVSVMNLTAGTTLSSELAFAYDTVTNTITITYPGFPNGRLSDGNYRIIANPVDAAGNPATSPYSFDFYVLSADANRDRVVDISDFAVLAGNFGATPRNFAQGDFNYDNKVDIVDFALLAGNFGHAVPAPSDLPRASLASSSELTPGLFSEAPVGDSKVDRIFDGVLV